MPARPIARVAAVAVVLFTSAQPAAAGEWITPDWPAGAETRYEPVPLFWFVVRECPLIYRTEVTVPPGADRATALLRASGCAYVYQRPADGSLRPSNVVRTMKKYFETAQPNRYYEKWPEHPKPGARGWSPGR